MFAMKPIKKKKKENMRPLEAHLNFTPLKLQMKLHLVTFDGMASAISSPIIVRLNCKHALNKTFMF